MYCKNCGGEVPHNAKFCPYCGTECGDNYFDEPPVASCEREAVDPVDNGRIYGYEEPKRTDEASDTGRFAWAVLGFFFPVVGLVLYFVMRKNKPRTAKKTLIGAIVGFAVETACFIFYLITVIVAALGGVAIDYSPYIDLIRGFLF